ncbi:MAG: tRNA (guanosine(46)-N7)-methyltransferase TrmB [Flavobacteriales bacterium]|nr:tRNA (guanosine(46)-N7)-methyltransferase TrmB [Flavobacteriales bacterium]
MAGKNKLMRFEALKTFDNVFQQDMDEIKDGFRLQGKWAKEYFKNDNPIVLELGCGKGEYSVALAERNPDKNYIGVDVRGERLYHGAKNALNNKLTNAAFIRTYIERINLFFAKDEIDELWFTFPDPQLKKSRIQKRLTSPGFLDLYRSFLKQGSKVHLKTDSEPMFEYSKEVAEELKLEILIATNNLYAGEHMEILDVKTYYENIYLKEGLNICYLNYLFK